MQYVVKIQYGRGPETPIAEFKDLNDAKLFIEKKFEKDDALRVTANYLVFEFNEVLEKFEPGKMSTPTAQEQQGSQGKGSGSSFTPTPFNMAPRPAGMPQKWLKDDDEEKK